MSSTAQHSRDYLCGTAAGYNALGTQHRQSCSACREAATKWANGFAHARANGTHLEWAKNNPPNTVHA